MNNTENKITDEYGLVANWEELSILVSVETSIDRKKEVMLNEINTYLEQMDKNMLKTCNPKRGWALRFNEYSVIRFCDIYTTMHKFMISMQIDVMLGEPMTWDKYHLLSRNSEKLEGMLNAYMTGKDETLGYSSFYSKEAFLGGRWAEELKREYANAWNTYVELPFAQQN